MMHHILDMEMKINPTLVPKLHLTARLSATVRKTKEPPDRSGGSFKFFLVRLSSSRTSALP